MPEMPLKMREWKSPGGNADHDHDVNAAINIQRKGITELMAADHVFKAHLNSKGYSRRHKAGGESGRA
ncbi:hypothetical protein S077_004564 [Salmonella enterica subsp. enterica]|nr:hypothetical protein [Salmonella enterica subsp. enterica serovar Paratyphi B]EDV4534401.1 hypothetical protein [Salmonella enterica subsp. enterica]